jgi:hypothetical protein
MVQPTDSSADPEPPPENGEVAPYAGPPLVYGIFRPLGTLIVLEHEWARRAADEFTRCLRTVAGATSRPGPSTHDDVRACVTIRRWTRPLQRQLPDGRPGAKVTEVGREGARGVANPVG